MVTSPAWLAAGERVIDAFAIDQQNPEDARKRVRLLGRGQPLPGVHVYLANKAQTDLLSDSEPGPETHVAACSRSGVRRLPRGQGRRAEPSGVSTLGGDR
jgi:hypothetical protein